MNKIENEIFVIDFETTGLESYPSSIPTEIAIYKINKDLEVHHIYDSLIGWSKKFKEKIDNSWWSEHSGVKFDNLKNFPKLEKQWTKIRKYLENQNATSWNTGYDFDKFVYPLMKDFGEFDLSELSCPMLVSTDILQIPGYYGNKWPSLDEAAAYFNINLDSSGYYHRADFDTHTAALIIVEMIKRGEYK